MTKYKKGDFIVSIYYEHRIKFITDVKRGYLVKEIYRNHPDAKWIFSSYPVFYLDNNYTLLKDVDELKVELL